MAKTKLSYWQRRQVQNMYQHMQGAEETADQISKLYLKASRYLSLQSDEIFEKFMTKHNLTEKEARQLISTMQDKASLDELLQKLKNSGSESKKELLGKLESPAYRARLERLQQLQNQLDQVMSSVYGQEKAISTSFYTELANESYYRPVFDMQQQVGAAFSFNRVDSKQIDQAINSKWFGKNYSERIWSNTKALSQDIKEELLINLVTGRTNREVAEIIADKHAQGVSKARRLVRTESNYVSSELNFKAYKECGIEKYQYLATLDLRTSKACQKLDGKIFLVKDREIGVNCNPMHPWCRSTTVSVVDEGLIARMQRSAIDPATGKRITVPRSMTYEQWYDKYVKGNPDAELEEKKLRNMSADRKQYSDYKESLGKDYVPSNLSKFQDIKYSKSNEYGILKAQTKGMTYYNKAVQNEPAITAHVKEVASKSKMSVEGLDMRIKGKESYLRKIRSNYDPTGNTYEVKDILRYTYTCEPGKFTENTLKSVESHQRMGYNTVETKNYWLDKNNPYNGVNTTVKAPEGQKFEIQYHTPESFQLKNGEMHELYEKQRMIKDISSEKYMNLGDKMFELSDALKCPKEIERVK